MGYGHDETDGYFVFTLSGPSIYPNGLNRDYAIVRSIAHYLSRNRVGTSSVRQPMAGIYLHVPFCKQACHYCDFHFSTNTRQRGAMISAMVQELGQQRHYLDKDEVATIYFGGGTPSLLSPPEVDQLLQAVYRHFPVAAHPEITLEANPDDLTYGAAQRWRQGGINRLSVGIQSFYDPHLVYLNRAHNAHEAAVCVQRAQDAGFDNVSIDLIYAIPAEGHRIWKQDLAQAIALGPQHISAYCLTIEEKTVFGRWRQQGKLRVVSDEVAAEQFDILTSALAAAGYEAYEVSNFCQPGAYARHNTSYWQGKKYLGIGPSAHSYDGASRQYNVPNNAKYLRAVERGSLAYEREVLSRYDRINEQVITGLRTKWGCDLVRLRKVEHYDLYEENRAYLDQLVAGEKVTMEEGRLVLTHQGRLLADGIAERLFLVNVE